MLSGLSDADAVALLAAANPGRVDAHVRDRVVAETRGNPLALLELPRGMTAAELAGGFAVPRSGDLPSQLEEHFLRRFESLPEATQRLMLLAAAEPTGDVVLLWRAAQALGIRGEAAEPPGAEQLVEFGAQVRFRHPLVRSAVYSRASGQDRRAMHLALAAAMDPHNDPDRRAWHRALAAEGPDEEVASELERSAGRPSPVVAWLRPQRSYNERSRSPRNQHSGPSARWPRHKRACRPERSRRRSVC